MWCLTAFEMTNSIFSVRLSQFYHSYILFFVLPTKEESHNTVPATLLMWCLTPFDMTNSILSIRNSVFLSFRHRRNHIIRLRLCSSCDVSLRSTGQTRFCPSYILFLSFQRRRNQIIRFRLLFMWCLTVFGMTNSILSFRLSRFVIPTFYFCPSDEGGITQYGSGCS